jgi:hypothetical protein
MNTNPSRIATIPRAATGCRRPVASPSRWRRFRDSDTGFFAYMTASITVLGAVLWLAMFPA